MLHRAIMTGCWNQTENIAYLWAEQRGLIVANEPVIRRYSVTQLQIILQHCAVSGIACSGHFLRSLAQNLTASRRNYPSVCLSVCRWLTTSFCRKPAWTDLGRFFISRFQLKMEKGTFSETSSALDPDTINSISATPTDTNSWKANSKIFCYFYSISSHFLQCYRLRKNVEDERTIKQQRPVIKLRTSLLYQLQVHFTKHVDSNPWLAINNLPATHWSASAGTLEMGRDPSILSVAQPK